MPHCHCAFIAASFRFRFACYQLIVRRVGCCVCLYVVFCDHSFFFIHILKSQLNTVYIQVGRDCVCIFEFRIVRKNHFVSFLNDMKWCGFLFKMFNEVWYRVFSLSRVLFVKHGMITYCARKHISYYPYSTTTQLFGYESFQAHHQRKRLPTY